MGRDFSKTLTIFYIEIAWGFRRLRAAYRPKAYPQSIRHKTTDKELNTGPKIGQIKQSPNRA